MSEQGKNGDIQLASPTIIGRANVAGRWYEWALVGFVLTIRDPETGRQADAPLQNLPLTIYEAAKQFHGSLGRILPANGSAVGPPT